MSFFPRGLILIPIIFVLFTFHLVRASDLPPSPGGELIYNKLCSKCHGVNGAGSENGPPLVHKIYEPSHHGDMSFYMAVRRGVSAHHWRFGNMAPLREVAKVDVAEIIKYIRRLQKEAGIF